jgi:hypothetical protein
MVEEFAINNDSNEVDEKTQQRQGGWAHACDNGGAKRREREREVKRGRRCWGSCVWPCMLVAPARVPTRLTLNEEWLGMSAGAAGKDGRRRETTHTKATAYDEGEKRGKK